MILDQLLQLDDSLLDETEKFRILPKESTTRIVDVFQVKSKSGTVASAGSRYTEWRSSVARLNVIVQLSTVKPAMSEAAMTRL